MGPFAWRPPFPEALRREETVNPTRPIGSGLPGRVASSSRISNALNHDCIELGALLLIGDGIMGLIKPRWHSLFWHFGPAFANSSIWSHIRWRAGSKRRAHSCAPPTRPDVRCAAEPSAFPGISRRKNAVQLQPCFVELFKINFASKSFFIFLI